MTNQMQPNYFAEFSEHLLK